MLQTNLKHIVSEEEFNAVIENNENVMICCGRMGSMCIPVYQAMIELEQDYAQVEFRDMAFDESVSTVVRELPECRGFMGLPFTVYYKNGQVVNATSGIQSKEQVQSILNEAFRD